MHLVWLLTLTSQWIVVGLTWTISPTTLQALRPAYSNAKQWFPLLQSLFCIFHSLFCPSLPHLAIYSSYLSITGVRSLCVHHLPYDFGWPNCRVFIRRMKWLSARRRGGNTPRCSTWSSTPKRLRWTWLGGGDGTDGWSPPDQRSNPASSHSTATAV